MRNQKSRYQSAQELLEQARSRSSASRMSHDTLPEDNDQPAAPAANLHASLTPEDHPLIKHDTARSEVYEESEEGIAYTPKTPPPDSNDN